MRRFSKKFTMVVVGAFVLVAGAGVAYAFWTAGGSGSGTASTATGVNVTVVQTPLSTAMAPGVAPQTLSGTFTNNTGAPVNVATVTASIGSVVPVGVAVCVAGNYTLANAVMTVGAQIPTGTGQGTWTGATIVFTDDPLVNQDGCKGATVNLAYVVS